MNNKNYNENWGTLTETIDQLVSMGYTHDFNIQDECIICNTTQVVLSPLDFQIDYLFRFEGISDPEYQSVLYAISSTKHNMKGILVNGYGPSADEAMTRLVDKLPTNTNQEAHMPNTNKATAQRPEGDRVLNDTLVELDISNAIIQLTEEPAWQESDRNSITLYKSDALRIVLLGLKPHAELKPHKAPGTITVQVLKGDINFWSEHQDNVNLKAHQMVVLQAQIMHSVQAVTESFFLLTMSMKS